MKNNEIHGFSRDRWPSDRWLSVDFPATGGAMYFEAEASLETYSVAMYFIVYLRSRIA